MKSLINEQRANGQHRVVWDGTDSHGNSVSTGVYFYEMIAGDFVETKKMLIIK